MRVRGLVLALAASLPLAPAQLLSQRPTFGPTLFWESGLINIPTAAVPPLHGDVAVGLSHIRLDSARLPVGHRQPASTNLTASVALWGRVEAGLSVVSGDFKNGAFAKVLLVDQTDGIWRTGMAHWLPSLAIGVRNLGSQTHLTRIATTGSDSLETAPSLYGVGTRTFALTQPDDHGRAGAQLSLTAGYGTGLFRDDASSGSTYSSRKTGGIFGGASLDFVTGPYSTFSLMAEQDGWGMNAAARIEFRGIRFMVGAMELGAKDPPAAGGFGGQKLVASFSLQANWLTLIRGNQLEARTAKLEETEQARRQEVRVQQQRVDALQGQIDAMRAISTEEKSAERAALERQLKEEQAALQRLQELLKASQVKKP